MPSKDKYQDEHRLFLQGLMCKGILNEKGKISFMIDILLRFHLIYQLVILTSEFDMDRKRLSTLKLSGKRVKSTASWKLHEKYL